MPSRRTVGWISIVLAVAFGGLFAVTLFFTSSFILWLVLWFLFCLCSFHAVLAFWTTISRRVARGSDYVYFSFALFGIFVASLAQGRDTNLYYAAVAGMVGPKDPAQVQRIIQQVMPWCDVFPQPPAPLTSLSFLYPSKLDGKTCSFLKSADALLEQHNYSAIPDFLTKTQPPLRARLLPTPYEMVTNNLYSNFKLALESLYYMNLPATSKDTDTFDRQLDTAIFKYLLSIIWPFILGFAVALRMTRTTADVTEWPI